MTINEGTRYPLRPRVHLIYKSISGGETFDEFEANGSNKFNPLVQFTNSLTNLDWYGEEIKPYVYYGVGSNFKITNREYWPIGIPPKHTINIIINKGLAKLNDEDLAYGVSDAEIGYAAFHSYLVHYIANDYSDKRAQVCTEFMDNTNLSEDIIHYIETPFPPIKDGNYKFKVTYMLPGINKVTSSKELVIKL
ncbi:MAG: hypothetical protein HC831_04930 [Chloroflexia bacterium]|nr:hypothetical protein [Chloroflexia bacterium]